MGSNRFIPFGINGINGSNGNAYVLIDSITLITFGCNGCNVLRIGQFEPSSKMCGCGIINKELKLSDRIWTCKSCNTTHNRDLLSANNIKHFAFLKNNTAGTAEIHAYGDMNEATRSA